MVGEVSAGKLFGQFSTFCFCGDDTGPTAGLITFGVGTGALIWGLLSKDIILKQNRSNWRENNATPAFHSPLCPLEKASATVL